MPLNNMVRGFVLNPSLYLEEERQKRLDRIGERAQDSLGQGFQFYLDADQFAKNHALRQDANEREWEAHDAKRLSDAALRAERERARLIEEMTLAAHGFTPEEAAALKRGTTPSGGAPSGGAAPPSGEPMTLPEMTFDGQTGDLLTPPQPAARLPRMDFDASTGAVSVGNEPFSPEATADTQKRTDDMLSRMNALLGGQEAAEQATADRIASGERPLSEPSAETVERAKVPHIGGLQDISGLVEGDGFLRTGPAINDGMPLVSGPDTTGDQGIYRDGSGAPTGGAPSDAARQFARAMLAQYPQAAGLGEGVLAGIYGKVHQQKPISPEMQAKIDELRSRGMLNEARAMEALARAGYEQSHARYLDRKRGGGGAGGTAGAGGRDLTAKQRQDLDSLTVRTADLGDALALLEKTDLWTHPLRTSWESLRSFFGGGSKEWQDLSHMLSPITAETIHDLAGSALTATEQRMYARSVPSVDDPPQVLRGKLTTLIAMNKRREHYMRTGQIVSLSRFGAGVDDSREAASATGPLDPEAFARIVGTAPPAAKGQGPAGLPDAVGSLGKRVYRITAGERAGEEVSMTPEQAAPFLQKGYAEEVREVNDG